MTNRRKEWKKVGRKGNGWDKWWRAKHIAHLFIPVMMIHVFRNSKKKQMSKT